MAKQYYLISPKKQLFYKIIFLILCAFGGARHNWWALELHKKIGVLVDIHGTLSRVLSPLAVVLLVLAFIDYKTLSFYILGIMCSILPVAMVVFIKIMSAYLKSYQKLMNDFLDKIHLHSFYMRNKESFTKLTLLEVEKYTRLTFYFLGGFLSIDWISWIVIPVINNVKNREFVLNKTMKLHSCLYLWMPFDYYYDYNRWFFMHCLSGYLAFGGCAIVTVFDTINFAFVFHLIGHIKILKHSIKVRFAENNMSAEEQKMSLIEVIKAHNFIANTFKEMQAAFGINVAGNYLQNLLEDSLLLYQLMFSEKGDKIPYGIMFIVYVGELFIMSFILEEVRRQSDDLPEVLYNIPWENMSLSNQKMFRLVLLRVQPTMWFKAAGGLRAGIKPMI
ncbi:uncharacterized protein LOC128676344 isoform X2 [Plodia interpunctella]|uniref:uncharacterized protein LOC128676344 isoform X2 n=1 Tax=Plodia interpunctella TaxID=58824 RepID=UPI0023679D43|nr:uncharacterized protein LOC128676344 isoform X2 [Plodia interpunctella]